MNIITLSNNLKILFQEASPEKIPNLFFNNKNNNASKNNLTYKRIPENYYSNYSFTFYPNYSLNERELYFNQVELECDLQNNCSHFNLLAEFGKETIELNGNMPLVKFDNIIEWRDVSHQMGQSIIIAAFLAQNSLLNNVDYTYWNWPTALRSNNRQLQNVLNNGMSENHYHLNGSTQIFPISWICIMNNPIIIHSRIRDIDVNLYPRWSFGNIDNTDSWESLLKNASIIRLKLFEKIRNRNNSKNLFSNQGYVSFHDIQKAVKRMSYFYAYKTEQNKYLDYALTNDLSSNNYRFNRILIGERKFLYDCFRASFSGMFTEEENNQFYYYILVKNRFRGEIIQSNNMTGFKNFSRYQDRKNFFFHDIDEYEREAVRLSLNDTLQYQSIKSLEARIMPKALPHKLERSVNFYDEFYKEAKKDETSLYSPATTFEERIISKINKSSISKNIINDNQIQKSHLDVPYFYILHYPKGTTKLQENQNCVLKPKNAKQRDNNLRYSKSIAFSLSRNDSMRSRIRGIDTCSSEIGCRPEVFATDYRYLKNYHCDKKNFLSSIEKETFLYLGRTYHAGEDFLDLVDGMRAIDETIQFLNFSNGDRLGHALALGLNPKDHYQYKGNKVILSRQDALDNFIWLYYRAGELNITIEPLLEQQLCNNINELSREIYGDFCEKNQIELNKYNLYCAWKLRGDHPDLYKSIKFSNPKLVLNQYEKAKYIDSKELRGYRNDNNISSLYYAYHFDYAVRKNGDVPFEFSINEKYINLVCCIQKKLQFQIAEKGIMIECNPSSNFLISTFKDYKKHPITIFNNLDLEIDQHKVTVCPQISVSINTDDQGVFDTSLEYEYALIASALIKDTDENGNYRYKPSQVYKYLDSVRRMGNEQTFLRDF